MWVLLATTSLVLALAQSAATPYAGARAREIRSTFRHRDGGPTSAGLAHDGIGLGTAGVGLCLAIVRQRRDRGRPAAGTMDVCTEGGASPGADVVDTLEEMRRFQEHAPCGFHTLDAEGRFVEVNATLLGWLQYAREELVGRKRLVDLLTPIGRRALAAGAARLFESGRVDELGLELVRKDGTLLSVVLGTVASFDSGGELVRSRSVVVLDRERPSREGPQGSYPASTELERSVDERTGELVAAIATLRTEIEERERAEELLRQSEERARAVVEQALDGIVTIDEQGFVESFNPAAERMFGWRERQIVGRNVSVLMPEPDASRHDAYLQRYLATGVRRVIGIGRELVGLRKDGTTFPLEIGIGEMHLGPRRLFHASLRDVSERKRAEERLARLQEDLRRKEVMASFGSLVAGLAHEARNPLFGISAVLDAMALRLVDRAELADFVAMMRRDVNRLGSLMRDLLEFGKPECRDLHASPLRPVLEEAIAECLPVASDAGVEIVSRLDAAACRVAQNERLVRVFQNLLQNAIQFSPRGARVEIDAVRSREGEDAWIDCRVRDAGPGFSSQDLPHLFEPFFTRRHGGTGLGLAIVQRIAEEHGGAVAAANHGTGGAMLSVRLPVTG